nr:carbohydrate binding family 9 domain-containing protein [Thermoflexibacter sp.]
MRLLLSLSSVIIFLFLFEKQAYSQDIFLPDSIKREVYAIQIETNLDIDGNLDEAEWQKARPVSEFVQVEPLQGNQANQDTEIRILYNKYFLYIAAFCKDSAGRNAIRVPDMRRDFDRDFDFRAHDFFGISIDAFNDKRNAMAFMTNPYGTQRDLLSFDDRLFDTDWDGLWRVRTQRNKNGWTAEIAIPWQTLRYPKTDTPSQSWGINFFRNRRKTNELTTWSPFPRAFSVLRMEYAGILKDIQPPPPSPNVRVQPYVLGVADKYNGNEVGYEQKTSAKIGGEVKWAINPNTVLDLTFNTDFAQADADRQVNNVTRFSVFFPERRQFFLENASLFAAGLAPADALVGGSMRIQPFFSRRIGLDDSGNPIPVDAGARLVSRSLKRNYGAIIMRQRGNEENGATNFAVTRYSHNIGKQNRVGGIFTMKNRESVPDAAGYTNWTGAVDGFFRLSQKLSLNMMAVGTSSTQNRGAQGMAGYLQFSYNSNQFVGWSTSTIVTKDFNPEMGFVSRYDVISNSTGGFAVWRPDWKPKWVRGFEPGMFVETYLQASTGRLQERVISFNPIWLAMQNGGFFGLFVTPTYQRLDETFSPLGIN